jgi:hypothetical protein
VYLHSQPRNRLKILPFGALTLEEDGGKQTERRRSRKKKAKSGHLTSLLVWPLVLPVGAVPLLPRAAAPLGELRDVSHADALPHGRLVADAHAEELDGPRGARARVVAVVPALRAPPRAVPAGAASASRGRPGAGRRQHAVARHGWRLLGLVQSLFLTLSPVRILFFLAVVRLIYLGGAGKV